MTDSKRQRLEHDFRLMSEALKQKEQELDAALEREARLVDALGDSCLCGEFEYIETKCPACIALEAHKKAKGGT